MTDISHVFGTAEQKTTQHIFALSGDRFRAEDQQDFPNWREIAYAFQQAAVAPAVAVSGASKAVAKHFGEEAAREITAHGRYAQMIEDFNQAMTTGQFWVWEIYFKGLMMALRVPPSDERLGAEGAALNRIYEIAGDILHPHLPARTRKLLDKGLGAGS